VVSEEPPQATASETADRPVNRNVEQRGTAAAYHFLHARYARHYRLRPML
jgi:hypothetical protein